MDHNLCINSLTQSIDGPPASRFPATSTNIITNNDATASDSVASDSARIVVVVVVVVDVNGSGTTVVVTVNRSNYRGGAQ